MPRSLLGCLVRALLFGTKKKRRNSFSILGKFGSLQQMVGKEKPSLRPRESELKVPRLAGKQPRKESCVGTLRQLPSAGSTGTGKQTQQRQPGPWAHPPVRRSGKIKCSPEKQQGAGTACASPCKAPAHRPQEPVNCTPQDFYQHRGAASEVSLLHSN